VMPNFYLEFPSASWRNKRSFFHRQILQIILDPLSSAASVPKLIYSRSEI
jgi:hypothetical protein